jgi:hypothetical protein
MIFDGSSSSGTGRLLVGGTHSRVAAQLPEETVRWRALAGDGYDPDGQGDAAMRVGVRSPSVVVAALLAGACSGSPPAPPPAAPEPPPAAPAPAAVAPSPQEKPASPAAPAESHARPRHRLGLSNAGALGLAFLADASPSAAPPPGTADILRAWGLVAREPAAARAFAELRDCGPFVFHLEALLCLAAIDDAAEFDRRFSALADGAGASDAEATDDELPASRPSSGAAKPETWEVWNALTEGDEPAFRALLARSTAAYRVARLGAPTQFDRVIARIKLDAIRHVVGPLPDQDAPVARRTWTGDAEPELWDLDLSDAGDLAVAVLSATTKFSGAAVGEGGETPTSVLAVRALLDERDAEPALRHLAHRGHAAARLYAACGLRALASPAAERTFATLRSSRDRVPTLFGCIGDEAVVADLAKQIESGEMADIAGR